MAGRDGWSFSSYLVVMRGAIAPEEQADTEESKADSTWMPDEVVEPFP